jgi:hypothetical protein
MVWRPTVFAMLNLPILQLNFSGRGWLFETEALPRVKRTAIRDLRRAAGFIGTGNGSCMRKLVFVT